MKSVPAIGLVTLFLVSLILFPCFAPACADSPPPFARVELNQPYSTRNMTVSEIDSVDFMDFDNAQVDIYSTTGDGSDVKDLQFPHFRDIRRVFSKNTATWGGNSLTILGPLDSTVDWSSYDEYTVFISRYLPRVHIEVPDTTANVVLFKANASTGITDIRSLLSSAEQAYLLNDQDGVLAIQRTPTTTIYAVIGVNTSYDPNDLAYTFSQNAFDISDYTLNQLLAGDVSEYIPPIAGEYILYAFRYDPVEERVTTYSSWPVIIMDGDNPLDFPSVYDKSSGQDPELTFYDASGICNISYVLIKTGETYDMRVDVNMSALEEEGAAHISSVLVSNPLVALLKNQEESIGSIGKVVSYSITRDGSPTPPPPEHPWQIAITPGYGISGYARDSGSVTVPHEDLSTLVTGKFSVYAMGLDAHNNIIALDQQYLNVIETPIAAFHATPTHGQAPLDVQFHDDSQGSPTTWDWDFGDETPHSYEPNPTHTYTAPGSYTVTLTVSNSFGSDDEIKEDYIVATGSPVLPHSFYGNVTLHGSPAPVDTMIEAQGTGVIIDIEGNPIRTEETGVYGGPEPFDPKLIVQGEIEESTPLRFYVDGFQAMCRDANTSSGWLWTYPFSPGVVTNLDLTVPAEPLEADFTATPRSGHAPLEVQFTDLSIGNPAQWDWDFGDGGTSSEEDPSHTYTSPGTYTVSLTVRDAASNQDTNVRTGYITVTVLPSPPVAQFKADVRQGPAPLTVQFTDLSSGSPYMWTWNFGDGDTSIEQNPVHTYESPGTYTVYLSVRNAGGTDTEGKINYITVSDAGPQAEFNADVTSGQAPLTVTFTDLSTGNPDSWTWTFGDGTSSGLQNPVHTYAQPGDYTVSLTARNSFGTDTETKTSYITVFGTTVDAEFAADKTSGQAPLTVTFTDLSTGNPESWEWTFGDGGSSVLQNPVHIYDSPGTYTVSLAVENPYDSGFISKPGFITVTDGPVPPVAGFTADRTSGYTPLTVQFTDTSAGNPTTWSWLFGDGSSSGQQNPVHTYADPGTYTVRLTVTNEFGGDTLIRPGYITASVPSEYFYINATAGSGGTIAPSGLIAVPPGEDQSFAITPYHNYIIQNVMVDGDARGAISEYTFPDVNANHTISAIFRQYGGGGGGGGSSGGSSTIVLPTTTIATTIPTQTPAPTGTIPLGTDNRTTQAVAVVSSDGAASIGLAQGTRPLDGSGQPLHELGITKSAPSTLPPAPGDGCQYTGYSYQLATDGASFDPAASLTITPSDADWQVLAGQDLVIKWYSTVTGAWVDLPTTIEHETGTVSASVTRGGTCALFSCTPAGTTPTTTTTTTQVPTTPVSEGFPWMLAALVGVIVLAVVILVIYITWLRPGAGKPPEI